MRILKVFADCQINDEWQSMGTYKKWLIRMFVKVADRGHTSQLIRCIWEIYKDVSGKDGTS